MIFDMFGATAKFWMDAGRSWTDAGKRMTDMGNIPSPYTPFLLAGAQACKDTAKTCEVIAFAPMAVGTGIEKKYG